MVDQLQYSYMRKRRDFGRPCNFKRDRAKLLDSLPPDRCVFKKEYVLKNPMDRWSQTCGGERSECDQVNSTRPEYESRGMNHVEGGWPKDINPSDPEQTLRFKKKIEKDEKYIHTFLQLSHAMEHCILQNNTLDLYEEYFPEVEFGGGQDGVGVGSAEMGSAQGLTVFQDPSAIKRPVHHISWCPDGGTRIAVAHCSLNFQQVADLATHTFIWHIDRPTQPELTLRPGGSGPLVCLEFNNKEPHVLAGGMYDGRVGCWDTRKGAEPAEASPLEAAHRDPVHRVLWLNSKSGTEFFSASSDGQVKWWDTRKLSEASETLILDPTKPPQEQQLCHALGAVSLEYESTIPTRFMVGTETGVVLNCNRKGKTPAEKLVCQYAAHLGPVYALQRNPAFVKNFLTVGDWSAKIWSEDVRESSIMSTSYGCALLTDGCWSPTRFSVFFTTRMDGCLDTWDVLQQRRQACLSVKVCDAPLRALRIHEGGQLVATGGDSGTTFLLHLSESLAAPQKNDKPLLTEMLDRETRREKIVEARKRERRVKGRVKGGEAPPSTAEIIKSQQNNRESLDVSNDDPQVVEAERHFFSITQPPDAEACAGAENQPNQSCKENAA